LVWVRIKVGLELVWVRVGFGLEFRVGLRLVWGLGLWAGVRVRVMVGVRVKRV
jgi:hypothetical protein